MRLIDKTVDKHLNELMTIKSTGKEAGKKFKITGNFFAVEDARSLTKFIKQALEKNPKITKISNISVIWTK